ncbi:hypothetical protein PybrP1_007695 [[Pythium] brassicae (nom. inval.)]|nr:hypothetical protein PybrP1_007695 [[Pythium] brassicae (nom. inval.)]
MLLRARGFATAATGAARSLNLTPLVSPLLLRLHPDTVQRHSAALAAENEAALKALNQFLELASAGCNGDTRIARRLALEWDSPAAAVALHFHVPRESQDEQLALVNYTIRLPGALVHRTLAGGGDRALSRTENALQTPFAREWQRATKRILRELFEAAAIPLDGERPTALARWLEEDDDVAPEFQHGVNVAAHNRARQREHEAFDKVFHSMLTGERNIVFATTTGLEDGPTEQHAVLMSLISERLRLPKLQTAEQRQVVFNWIANFLLMHFLELRLHSLVWNKVTLLVTIDESVARPEVSWDDEQPELGMGFLIPAGTDANALVDFLYEHVDALEAALAVKVNRRR